MPSVRSSSAVLLDQRSLGFRQDAEKIVGGQVVQFHPDRESTLELGNQVRGFGDVKSACSDEENVVRLYRTVLGHHRRTLDDG